LTAATKKATFEAATAYTEKFLAIIFCHLYFLAYFFHIRSKLVVKGGTMAASGMPLVGAGHLLGEGPVEVHVDQGDLLPLQTGQLILLI
jgi:hypothetical protein